MILPWEKLREYDFAFRSIRVFHQKPSFRQQRHPSRKLNGFVYLLQGKCRFSHKNGQVTLTPGGLCYLPYGSNHNFEILDENTEIYRLDFHLTIDDEVVLFSEGPLLIANKLSEQCTRLLQHFVDNYAYEQNTVAKTELLCGILRGLSNDVMQHKKQTLEPAIRYLLNHMTEKIYCAQLAKLCNLSTAQFYSVFREEYGTTPMAYREKLLMQRAYMMLAGGEFSVGEVSDALGFESPAYFSRFFKKHEGVPPSQYMRKQKGAPL